MPHLLRNFNSDAACLFQGEVSPCTPLLDWEIMFEQGGWHMPHLLRNFNSDAACFVAEENLGVYIC